MREPRRPITIDLRETPWILLALAYLAAIMLYPYLYPLVWWVWQAMFPAP